MVSDARRGGSAGRAHACTPSPPRRVMRHTRRRSWLRPLTAHRARHRCGGECRHGAASRLAGISRAVACATPAAAASWFELNFGLTGPRYDAPRAAVRRSGRARADQLEVRPQGRRVLELQPGNRRHRPHPRGRVPSLGARRRSRAGSATASRASRTAASTPVHYSISETGGWLGVGWGVEWCVVGLDRNWAYNPSCRMARP